MPDLNFDPASRFNPVIAEWEIEHEDVFNLKRLLTISHDWLYSNGWRCIDSKDERFETLYNHKVLANGNIEHNIWWRAFLIPKKSEYVKWIFKLDFQTINMGKTKINGASSNKGDIIIRCKSYMMMDYQRKWRDHKILKYFHNYFMNKFYRDELEQFKIDLWNMTYELEAVIKEFMKLKHPVKIQKQFHPDKGV